jgi:hypothetical protein
MVAAIVYSAMVETRRLNGTVRQRHIASLGAITLERERTHRFRLLVKSLGLSAGMARRRAQAQGQDQARRRCESAELSLRRV